MIKKSIKARAQPDSPKARVAAVPMDTWTHGRYKTSSRCSNNLDTLQSREVLAHIWVLRSNSITLTFVKWLCVIFRLVLSQAAGGYLLVDSADKKTYTR